MPRIFGPNDGLTKPARHVLVAAAAAFTLLAIGLPGADAFSTTTSISRPFLPNVHPSSKNSAISRLSASTIADSDTAASTDG